MSITATGTEDESMRDCADDEFCCRFFVLGTAITIFARPAQEYVAAMTQLNAIFALCSSKAAALAAQAFVDLR